MASEINYKAKYQELKLKFMNSVDMAFRLGYEQGAKEEQMNSMQQQADQAAQMAQEQQGQEQPGQEAEEQPEAVSENPSGSELDQHIAKLESLISKSESAEIKKSLNDLKAIRASQLQAIELKKSEKAIKGIAKAMKKHTHRPLNIAPVASHNMHSDAKAALTLQHKIVGDIMKTWEQEETSVAKNVTNILSIEGLTKKE